MDERLFGPTKLSRNFIFPWEFHFGRDELENYEDGKKERNYTNDKNDEN